jgi:hypothetical protein
MLTIAIACANLTGSAHAQTSTGVIRVINSGTDVAGCGSASNPCRTPYFAVIQSIANGAFSGEVRIAGGTYTQSNDPNLIKVSVFTSNLRITGGYSANNWAVSNPAANPTILDGQNQKRGILITVSGDLAAGCNVTVSNLTIQNGRAPSTDPRGGGINIENCQNAIISNVTVTNSNAIGENNTNAGVTSAGLGGGISVLGASTSIAKATLNNVTLTNNQAIGGSESSGSRGGLGNGAGLFGTYSRIIATNLVVSNNQAAAGDAPGRSGASSDGQLGDSLGGGIALIDCPEFSLTGITVSSNVARGGDAGTTGGYGLGGGIFIERSVGSISNALISNNQAFGGAATTTGGGSEGGGIFSTDTDLTLDQVDVVGNSITGGAGSSSNDVYGGGIFTTRGTTTLSRITGTNLIIADNSGSIANGFASGGGLGLRATEFSLNHVTLADNSTSGGVSRFGQAVYITASSSGSLNNSIFSGHSGNSSIFADRSTATLANILTNDTSSSFSATDQATVTIQSSTTGNPLFVTSTTPGESYRIRAGSPAINAASSSSLATDIDGQKRPIGAAADLGADEYQLAFSATAGETYIALSWDAPAGATVTRYEVIYNRPSSANDAVEGASPVNAGNSTSFILTGLSSKSAYTVSIRAYHGGTVVAESDTLTVLVGPARIFLPVIINPS